MTNTNTKKPAVSPVDAKIDAILARMFPTIETFEERGRDHLDFKEVSVSSIKQAVAEAFAAGRDFEGVRRDRRAERDAKAVR